MEKMKRSGGVSLLSDLKGIVLTSEPQVHGGIEMSQSWVFGLEPFGGRCGIWQSLGQPQISPGILDYITRPN